MAFAPKLSWGSICQLGTWRNGITPAQHAGGPGFKPQYVHSYIFAYVIERLRKGGDGGEGSDQSCCKPNMNIAK